MIVRLLSDDDRSQAKALWQTCFDDPPAFVDWFFEHRYLPRWSVGVFDGAELISVIHGTPMQLSLGQEASFAALMTSGVATVPNRRGQGHMHGVMLYLQAQAERQGIRALFNHPQRPGAYAHLGFRPSTFTKYWQGAGEMSSGQIAPFSEEEAFRIYTTISNRYTCFVRRDRAAFRLKMADYAADGAKGFLLTEAGETVGYCVYFDKETVCGEEVLSLTEYGPLLHELKRVAAERSVSAKLPPDADAPGELLSQNVMLAPDDIWQALKTTGRPCYCVDEY